MAVLYFPAVSKTGSTTKKLSIIPRAARSLCSAALSKQTDVFIGRIFHKRSKASNCLLSHKSSCAETITSRHVGGKASLQRQVASSIRRSVLGASRTLQKRIDRHILSDNYSDLNALTRPRPFKQQSRSSLLQMDQRFAPIYCPGSWSPACTLQHEW